MKLEDYLIKRRDTQREHELAQKLRELPEEERFQNIQKLMNFDRVVGLEMANFCLRKKEYFEIILNQGLKTADASSIYFWLKCVTPRLGFRRVVSILTQKFEADPRAVTKAFYWLGRFMPSKDTKSELAWRSLQDLVKSYVGGDYWPVDIPESFINRQED